MEQQTKQLVKLELPTLYPKQQDAICSPARWALIEASTKAGKSTGCLVWLLALGWNDGHKGWNAGWVAPTYRQAKRIGFDRMYAALDSWDARQTWWSYSLTELTISLFNGATYFFLGGDRPETIYGDDWYAAVIDEATLCRPAVFYAVRTLLTFTKGPCRIIGNVRGRKNWAYKLARKAQAGEKNMSYAKLTAKDAVDGGVLDAEEIEDAKRLLPENVFKELYMAEPCDDEGNPFGIKAINAICKDGISSGEVVAYGADLAKSRDWAVLLGLDVDGRTARLERWQGDWRGTRQRLALAIKDKPAYIDSTGVGDPIVEDLQRVCPHVQGFKFTSQSKQQLMEGLALGIQQQEIWIPNDPEHAWLKAELDSFEYLYTRTGVKYTAPEGMHDDGVDTLALAFMCHKRRPKNELIWRMIGYDEDELEDEEIDSFT